VICLIAGIRVVYANGPAFCGRKAADFRADAAATARYYQHTRTRTPIRIFDAVVWIDIKRKHRAAMAKHRAQVPSAPP